MPGLPNHPAGTSRPADSPCRPAPAPQVHDLLHHLHRLRPGPAWRLVSLFSAGAFITLAAASLWSGAWVLPADPRPDIEATELAVGIDAGITFGLGLAVVVTAMATVLEVAVGLWRELRELPG